MKESTEKKITTLKVFKVIVIIYSCVIIALLIHTVYGWATGTYDTNYVFLASRAAKYGAHVALYGRMEKKEAKKKPERINRFIAICEIYDVKVKLPERILRQLYLCQ